MAGNVLGKGYTAGVGMSIGTAFGRIAGNQAAAAALGAQPVDPWVLADRGEVEHADA